MRFRGRARPISVFDDVAVPPAELAAVLQRLQGLLQQQNVTWTLDAYAGEGRLRLRPFLDLADPGDRAKLEPLAGRVLRHRPRGRRDDLELAGLRPGSHPVPPQAVRRAVAGLPRDQGCLRPAGPAQSGQGHRRRPAPDAPQPEAVAHAAVAAGAGHPGSRGRFLGRRRGSQRDAPSRHEAASQTSSASGEIGAAAGAGASSSPPCAGRT